MALNSMDDKILGEKVDYYISSDEEDDVNSSGDEKEETAQKTIKEPKFIPIDEYNGRAVHTGPKGVMEDWRRYKQLEVEQRENDEKERLQLMKKLSLTCRSTLDDDKEKKLQEDEDEDDDFMEWYKQKRIKELQQKIAQTWEHISFGNVVELQHSSYVEAIEEESAMVTVLIHIYEEHVDACAAVNGCFTVLAEQYKYVKFCKIKATEARVSTNFMQNALPAVLAYKDKMLVGNFIRISDKLGEDFFATDMEGFLNEYGLLTGRFSSDKCYGQSKIITESKRVAGDSDSD